MIEGQEVMIMQGPYFSISNYGAFNSSVKKRKASILPERMISAYEFEFYTEDCTGGLMIDGVRYNAKKGFFSCTKPGQRQRMVMPYKCYFFNICTQDEELCELLDSMPQFAALWNMEDIVNIFRKMLTVENMATLENRMHLEGCILQIISLVARSQLPESGEGKDSALLHRKILQDADKYIRIHFAEDIGLAEMAQRFNLHPNYFHRLYTTAFGMSPAQRLLACRIKAAKMLLLTTNLSMSEIAAQCGFSSQTYFGYKFKEVTKYTPLQYRKKMLGNRKT